MLVIGIISIVIYLVAILMIFTNTYEFEKQKKIKFMLIGVVIVFIITWIIVCISSSGIQIEKKEYLKITKKTSTLIFAPINTVIALPYIGNVINQYKQKRLNDEQIKKRMLLFALVLFVIAIIETSYIKTFQVGLLNSVMK